MGKSTLIETWVQRHFKSDKYAIGAYFSFSEEQNKGMQDAFGSMIVKLIEVPLSGGVRYYLSEIRRMAI